MKQTANPHAAPAALCAAETQIFSTSRVFRVEGTGSASAYCAQLLSDLGARVDRVAAGPRDLAPEVEWARCGAMALSGEPDSLPREAPGPVASSVRGAVRAFAAIAKSRGLAGFNQLHRLDAPALLGERAACLGLSRGGRVSAGGTCSLLRASDDWIALNLPRDDDWRSLPALLESPAPTQLKKSGEEAVGAAGVAHAGGPRESDWKVIAERIAQRPAAHWIERCRLLGLAAARVGEAAGSEPWLRIVARGRVRDSDGGSPLVLDLSSLWAGPLCTHLLGLAGARVVKVESESRPDGARGGDRRFFDLLNAEKRSVSIRLERESGRARLRALIAKADIVVESARPRALQQLGIDASVLVEQRPGLTWLSLTGYGRSDRRAEWVAFGDDAAAAAGAVVAGHGDAPTFCGDALADPVAGVHAATAALASWSAGGGRLIDVNLANALAYPLAFRDSVAARDGFEVEARPARARDEAMSVSAAPPRAREPRGRAPWLGEHNDEVLREFELSC